MDKKKNEKKEGTTPVEIPAGAKFILVFEKDKKLGIQSGGFMNLDEMLGFNRRCVNAELVERMVAVGLQKQSQEQAERDQQQTGGGLPSPEPVPTKTGPEGKKKE